MRWRAFLLPLAALAAFGVLGQATAAEPRIGTWNIANLHHEEDVPLRPRAQARFDDAKTQDHLWQMINDGAPNGLTLRKGPPRKNTNSWPSPHKMFFAAHIDCVIFDSTLDGMFAPARIEIIGLPFQDDPKYAGDNGARLSDHCAAVARMEVSGPLSVD